MRRCWSPQRIRFWSRKWLAKIANAGTASEFLSRPRPKGCRLAYRVHLEVFPLLRAEHRMRPRSRIEPAHRLWCLLLRLAEKRSELSGRAGDAHIQGLRGGRSPPIQASFVYP